MKYEFYCSNCNAIDEVERPMQKAADPYHCPECQKACKRHYTAPMIQTPGEQKKYYHPAFGQVVTDREAKQMARDRGWTEIGNEDVKKHTPPPQRNDYDFKDYFV